MKLWLPDRDRWTKPPVGIAEIDWSHPLSRGLVGCWLFNEGAGGTARNLVTAGSASLYSSVTWGPTGINLVEGWKDQVNAGKHPVNLTAQTYLLRLTITNHTDNPFIVNKGSTTIEALNAGLIRYKRFHSTTNKLRNMNYTPASYATGEHTYAVSDDGALAYSGTSVYVDGVALTNSYSENAVGTITDDAATDLILGQYTRGAMYQALIWSRALTQAEIQEIHYQPYCFLRPTRTRTYFVAGGAPAASKVPLFMATYRRRRTG